MSTPLEVADYLTEQLGGVAHGITARKMFGEYGVFGYGKFFGVICDGMLYLKPTPAGVRWQQARGCYAPAPPYNGAHDYLRVDNPDDARALQDLAQLTLDALPEPKPRKPRGERAKKSAPREG